MMESGSKALERRSSCYKTLPSFSTNCSLANGLIVALLLLCMMIGTCFLRLSAPRGLSTRIAANSPAFAGLIVSPEAKGEQSIVGRLRPKVSLLEDVVLDKPRSFKRSYEYIMLANGLRTLIVHDANSTKSALSVAVDAGSMDNPENLKGLAHFCEHMLFLGTEKYPEAGQFDGFLAQAGGNSNAWTADEATVYFAAVSSNRSEEAVDRLADFFRAPLFSTQFVDKELNAIESEHAKNKQDPSRRTFEIFHALANPRSPLSWFATGNLETLKKEPVALNIDLIEELKKYFNRNYCPSRMRLVMHGSEAPDEQKRRAEKYFGSIPNGSIECQRERRSWEEPKAWTQDRLGKFVAIEGTSPKSELWLQFILPPTRAMWAANPIAYMNYVITYDGEDSLQKVLKDELGLIYSITLSTNDGSYGTEVFVIASLTPLGAQEYNTVIDVFFKYLSSLRKNGVDEKLYQSIGKVDKLSWEWQEQANPADEVQSLATSMLNYPAQSVLSAGQRIDQPNVSLVAELMSMLHPDNMNVALVDPDARAHFFDSGTQLLTLPHYEARYMVFNLSIAMPCQAQKWSFWLTGQIENLGDQRCSAFSNTSSMVESHDVPQPPTYIENVPDELDTTHMHAEASLKVTPKPSAVALHGKLPIDLLASVDNFLAQRDGQSLSGTLKETDAFYREGWMTESPKISMDFRFDVPRSENSFEVDLERNVRLSIYQKLLAEDIDPKLYDLSVAGCAYSVNFDAYQVSFHFGGFAPLVPVMMERVLSLFGKPVSVSDTKRYDRILEDTRTELQTYSDMPITYAVSDRNLLLSPGSASRHEQLAAISTLTPESVVSSMSDLQKKSMKLTGLVMGNLGQSEAEKAFGSMIALANLWEGSKAISAVDEEIRRVTPVVHPKQPVEVRRLNQRPDDPNHAVISSYLIGVATVEARVLARLLSPKLHEVAYQELRTNRQLGYVVSAGISTISNVLQVSAMVQGSKLNADELEGAIEHVYQTAFPAALKNLTDSDFASMVSSLTSQLLEPPTTFADEVRFFWNPILTGKDCLGLADEMLSYLRDSVTLSVLIAFWENISYPSGSRSKVTVKHFANNVPPRPSKADSVKTWKAQGVPDSALGRLETEYDATMVLTNATSAERRTLLEAGSLYPTDVICKRSTESQGAQPVLLRTSQDVDAKPHPSPSRRLRSISPHRVELPPKKRGERGALTPWMP